MKYINRSFTMPTTNKDMSKLEYDLRVGNITQEQYDLAQAALETAKASEENLKNMTFSG